MENSVSSYEALKGAIEGCKRNDNNVTALIDPPGSVHPKVMLGNHFLLL